MWNRVKNTQVAYVGEDWSWLPMLEKIDPGGKFFFWKRACFMGSYLLVKHEGHASYIWIFPPYLGDGFDSHRFPTYHMWGPTSCWKIMEYQNHPRVYWKFKCNYCLSVIENRICRRPPLWKACQNFPRKRLNLLVFL